MERLRSRGYLDDQRYAERFARSGLALRGLGRHRLRAELVRRGVERPLLERGLAEALDEVSEAGILEGLAQKYWRLHQQEPPERRIQKLWAFLLRRGFPAALVRERLEELWPRARRALEGLEPDAENDIPIEAAPRHQDLRRQTRERKP